MSRIGREAITVPAGVNVKIEGQHVTVKGPKGELQMDVHPSMTVKLEDGVIHVTRPDDMPQNRALHGLTRTLINNMVIGVTNGFEKKLEIEGTGYKAAKSGNKLVLTVGYSHNVEFEEKDGITFDVPAPNRITVKGISKQQVGQIAANIREVRPPEPYKGKGIRYAGEFVRRKVGKTGK